MIVETDKNELKFAEQLVREVYGGCNMVTFTNSEEAYKYAEKNPVDVCFTEVYMKPISGFSLTELLQEKNRQVVINLMADTTEYAIDAWGHCVNDYIVKPITRESIIHTLRGQAAG